MNEKANNFIKNITEAGAIANKKGRCSLLRRISSEPLFLDLDEHEVKNLIY